MKLLSHPRGRDPHLCRTGSHGRDVAGEVFNLSSQNAIDHIAVLAVMLCGSASPIV